MAMMPLPVMIMTVVMVIVVRVAVLRMPLAVGCEAGVIMGMAGWRHTNGLVAGKSVTATWHLAGGLVHVCHSTRNHLYAQPLGRRPSHAMPLETALYSR